MATLIGREYDPFTGITEECWYEEGVEKDKGKITIRRLQDVEYTLAMNKVAFNGHNRASYRDSNGMHHVATIPNIIVEKWMREGFNWYNSTDAERKAKLNDRDNRKLLVRPGRL